MSERTTADEEREAFRAAMADVQRRQSGAFDWIVWAVVIIAASVVALTFAYHKGRLNGLRDAHGFSREERIYFTADAREFCTIDGKIVWLVPGEVVK